MNKKVINLLVAIRLGNGKVTPTAVQIQQLFSSMIKEEDNLMIGQVFFAYSKEELSKILSTSPVDVVLCGETLSGEAIGAGSIRTWMQQYPNVRIVLLMEDNKMNGLKFYSLIQKKYYDMLFHSEFASQSHELIHLLAQSRTLEELIEHYDLEDNEQLLNIPAAVDALKNIAAKREAQEAIETKEDDASVESLQADSKQEEVSAIASGKSPVRTTVSLSDEVLEEGETFFDDDIPLVSEHTEDAVPQQDVIADSVDNSELFSEDELMSLLDEADDEELPTQAQSVLQEEEDEFFDEDDALEEDDFLGDAIDNDIEAVAPQTEYTSATFSDYSKDFSPSVYSGNGYILNVVGSKSIIWESSDKDNFPNPATLSGTRCYLLIPYLSPDKQKVAMDIEVLLPALKDAFKPVLVPVKGTVVDCFNRTTLLLELDSDISEVLSYLQGKEVVLVRNP